MTPTDHWFQVPRRQPDPAVANRVYGLLNEFDRFGDTPLVCATLLTAVSGLDLQDIVTLRWCDVDCATGTIAVSSPTSPDIKWVRMSVDIQRQFAGWRRSASTEGYVFFPSTTRDDAAERIVKAFDRAWKRIERPFTFQTIRGALAQAR